MKRNPNSSRSIKWIERNSLNNESCKRYVEKLCISMNFEYFKIGEYDIEEQALWITYGLYSYIIEVDKDDISLKVFESNKNQKEEMRYHIMQKRFNGDSCWYECLTWIKNRVF